MKITAHRWFTLLLFSGSALASPALSQEKAAENSKFIAYVGTYTTAGDWRGEITSKGIYALHYDATTGKLASPELAAESGDPSFVAVHPNGKYLYAVNELGNYEGPNSGSISAFAIDPHSHKLTLLNQVGSGGAGPCHISFDRSGKYVLVANYDGGSVSVHPIGKDGRLGRATSVVQHHGSGPDVDRQQGPHAHWIGASPDNRFVMAADLGLDEVLVYHFDASKGTLTPNDPAFAKAAPGSGPRHVAFHPSGNFVYLITEMAGEVTAFAFDPQKGSLAALQTLTTLPADYAGVKEDAEIAVHPSGKFLYASIRGHDSIAMFSIDPAKGTLTSLGQVPTQGKTPRCFVIDPSGRYLLAANQVGHTIVVFKIDPATGALTPAGDTVDVQAPTSIAFLPVK
jgi:6-phosphogluconolactonase